MNSDISDRIELEKLETGDVLEDPDIFYATARTTVTLPNDGGGLTNHPKGERVKISKVDAIRRFGENQVNKLTDDFNKYKTTVELKEVISAPDGKFYAKG